MIRLIFYFFLRVIFFFTFYSCSFHFLLQNALKESGVFYFEHFVYAIRCGIKNCCVMDFRKMMSENCLWFIRGMKSNYHVFRMRAFSKPTFFMDLIMDEVNNVKQHSVFRFFVVFTHSLHKGFCLRCQFFSLPCEFVEDSMKRCELMWLQNKLYACFDIY